MRHEKKIEKLRLLNMKYQKYIALSRIVYTRIWINIQSGAKTKFNLKSDDAIDDYQYRTHFYSSEIGEQAYL